MKIAAVSVKPRHIPMMYCVRLLATTIVAGLLFSCGALLPLRIERKISLQEVIVKDDGSEVTNREFAQNTRKGTVYFVHADAQAEIGIAFQNKLVEIELFNKTGDILRIDWDKSNFIDQDGYSHRLVKPGSIGLLSGKKSKLPASVPPQAKVLLQLTPEAGDTTDIGLSRWLFKIDRYNEERARTQARESLGKEIRILLTLGMPRGERQYMLISRLNAVTIDDEPVTR